MSPKGLRSILYVLCHIFSRWRRDRHETLRKVWHERVRHFHNRLDQ